MKVFKVKKRLIMLPQTFKPNPLILTSMPQYTNNIIMASFLYKGQGANHVENELSMKALN